MAKKIESKIWTRKKITEKKKKMNFMELSFQIKNNPKTAFIVLLSTMLVFDYFIYTDVFHLNQADFFNYTYSSIFSQQFFVIFILLPFITLGIIFFIYRMEYILLQKIDFKNYLILDKNYLVVVITIFVFGMVLYGEGLVLFLLDDVYLFLKKINISVDNFIFFIFLNGLFFLVNIITLYLLVSFSSILSYQFQSIKRTTIFTCILCAFIGLKFAIYPIITLIFPQYNFDSSQRLLIFLNIIIFIVLAGLYVSNKSINKNNNFFDVKKTGIFQRMFLLSIGVIFLVIDISFAFYNIRKMYRTPYEDLSFWQKNIYSNSLSIFNLSLFMNPLRISQFHDIKNLEIMLHSESFFDFIENKQIPRNNLTDINTTLSHLMQKSDKKEKIFFLPNNDRKLLFLLDNNQTITVLHVKDNNSSSSAILIDVGYIKLKN